MSRAQHPTAIPHRAEVPTPYPSTPPQPADPRTNPQNTEHGNSANNAHKPHDERYQRCRGLNVAGVPAFVTTGQLAAALGVSASAVLKWYRAGLIEPELVTPGGHLRWDVDSVRAQLRDQRRRDE